MSFVAQGTLKGFDQTINLVLADSHERTFSTDKGVEREPLGLYIVRGDSIAVVGELDEDEDASIDWDEVRGAPLAPIVQGGV